MINDVKRVDNANIGGWMIHALLPNAITSDSRSNYEILIRDRASLLDIDDLSVVATYICSTNQEDKSLDSQIRLHSSLVNELHQVVDILPFRFGVIIQESEMIEVLRQNANLYHACLESIRGYTELNLRWAVLDGSASDRLIPVENRDVVKATGHEYLMSKLRGKQRGNRIEQELRTISDSLRHRFTSFGIKTQSSVGKLKVKGQDSQQEIYVIAKIDLLVPRLEASGILSNASGLLLRAEKPTVASGPWPPYSFIEQGVSSISLRQMQRCANTLPSEAVS
ncbi:MAG: GvpL/GvpF family gas vesicle protein [Pirellula sp.]|jgi:hypothetical protein